MNVLGNTRDEEGQLLLPGGRVGFLLLHGLGGTPVELRFVAQGLNRAGYTVLCPLMLGHGGSDLLLSTMRWQDWVGSAEAAFDRLSRTCDHVIVGGLSGIHQWVRIGHGAIIGAVTMVTNDVIPYGLVQAPRGELDGLNLVGLKRRGVERAEITALRAAYQTLAQGDGAFQDRARRLTEDSDSPLVREIADFILAASDRNFLTPKGPK